MSTDRELLELAAKAVGIKGTWNERGQCLHITDQGFQSDVWWRPHLDDGDALRLATKLGICISFIPDCDTVQVFQYAEVYNVKTEGMDDFGVRRAIVCAAAEIGRRMP